MLVDKPEGGKIMKKYISAMSAAFLAGTLFLGACAKPAETPAADPETTEETKEETTDSSAALGGWTAYTDYVQIIDENEKALFEKAVEKLLGVNYTPVQVIATQTVSGKNYAFLAATETVTAEPKKGFAIVTVYEDTNGNAEVLAVNEIDPANVMTKDNADDPNVLGGWEVTDTGKVAGIGADAEAALSEALNGFTGVNLKPIITLGTQTVNGTNYRYLCRGSAVTENPVMTLYVTTVTKGSDGKCTITENQVFDLVSYVTPAE